MFLTFLASDTPVKGAVVSSRMKSGQYGLEKDDVFPTLDHTSRHIWGRLVKHAGINDLRYHDFNHEAVSHFLKWG